MSHLATLSHLLWRTTACRFITLQQIAKISGLDVNDLLTLLQQEAGQPPYNSQTENEKYISSSPPEWFNHEKVVQFFNATPIINDGESCTEHVLAILRTIQAGEFIRLQTPQVPVILINILTKRGYRLYSTQNSDNILTFIEKKVKKH